jgi:hypothetical protein
MVTVVIGWTEKVLTLLDLFTPEMEENCDMSASFLYCALHSDTGF